MSRLTERFCALEKQGRPGLVAYLTAGDPAPSRTVELALALERGGADVIELGVPFSDPIADGPVIQRASDRALRAGTTLEHVLDIASEIRAKSEIPLVLFSYLNPLMRYGFSRLSDEAAKRGIDGVLLTDLSVEEAPELVKVLRARNLDCVFLAAPTSTDRRLNLIAQYSSGFVYVVSRTGVTGERDSVAQSVEPLVKRLRQHTELPLAVGFGVSRREHFSEIGRYANAVVVGSAFVRLIEEHAGEADLEQQVERLAAQLTGGVTAP